MNKYNPDNPGPGQIITWVNDLDETCYGIAYNSMQMPGLVGNKIAYIHTDKKQVPLKDDKGEKMFGLIDKKRVTHVGFVD